MTSSLQQSVSQVINSTEDIDIERSFEVWINRSLKRRPDLAKKINVIYQINIKFGPNSVKPWTLDLTTGSGNYYKGSKSDVKCSIGLTDSDLANILINKNYLRKLFVERKLSLKGTRVALEKFQQFWVESDNCNKDFKFIMKSKDETKSDDMVIANENHSLLDSFNCNGFKSDVIFHTLKNRMHEEKDIVKQLSGIMQFDINKDDIKSVWTIDFTQPLGQNVYPGAPKGKPVCILSMADEDFAKMMVNKLNPQKAFMMGKMRVKGQILAIYKLFTVWIDAAFNKKRAPEVPYIEKILFSNDLISGLKSEIIIFRLIQRFVKYSQLCKEVEGNYYFNITKDSKLVSKWKLDFSSDKTCGVFSRLTIDSDSKFEPLITIEDIDFALMALNMLNIEKAMTSNRIKGDITLAPKLFKIFQSTYIQKKMSRVSSLEITKDNPNTNNNNIENNYLTVDQEIDSNNKMWSIMDSVKDQLAKIELWGNKIGVNLVVVSDKVRNSSRKTLMCQLLVDESSNDLLLDFGDLTYFYGTAFKRLYFNLFVISWGLLALFLYLLISGNNNEEQEWITKFEKNWRNTYFRAPKIKSKVIDNFAKCADKATKTVKLAIACYALFIVGLSIYGGITNFSSFDRSALIYTIWSIVLVIWCAITSTINLIALGHYYLLTRAIIIRFSEVHNDFEYGIRNKPQSEPWVLSKLFEKHYLTCDLVKGVVLIYIIINGLQLLLVSVSSAKITSMAHKPYHVVHGIGKMVIPENVQNQAQLFVERLSSSSVGMTILDGFVVSGGVLSSILTGIITYFSIIVEMN
ncbi:uncharacterized protein LOC128963578 [Oppia nitens]|uniref:uncharacterized protein LOC128963578 n=1 Tax=Oppia nitens TaxID=1686743 RepID=UPI0023DAEAD0|nr:uncharacterized protein LOC128963578 [Oppia nitens]